MKALDARVRGPMRTYGLLVNPWTIAVVRVLGNALWPVRKFLCLLLGHEPQAGHGEYGWDTYCWRCGQSQGR